MARTSAKAKKSKQEVNKSKAEAEKQENTQGNDSDATSDSTDKENDSLNFEVEKILHTRVYKGKRQYLVRWKGYKEDSDTWENESAVHSCTEALEAFKKENSFENESDSNAENDEIKDSEDGDDKGKKKTTKLVTKKNKKAGRPKTAKPIKIEKEDQGTEESSESDKETDEKMEEVRGTKRTKKVLNKTPAKKTKRNSEVSKSKKTNKSHSDDESVTDGSNYEVDKILEVHTRKNGSREFLIRWKGYKPSEDTWEPEAHLDCQDLIDKFMDKVDKAKSIPPRELRETRVLTNRFIPIGKKQGRSNLRNTGYRPCYQE